MPSDTLRPILAEARSLFFPGEAADYSGVLRRVELAAVLARNDVEVERRLGAEVWEQVLRTLDSGGRLLAIRNEPGFCCWGLYERVLQEAAQVIRRKPVEAADLAHLAIEIAESLDVGSYGEERVQDFRAAASSVDTCTRNMQTSSGRAGCWIWTHGSRGVKGIPRRRRASSESWWSCTPGLVSISISLWPRSISRKRSAFRAGGWKRRSFWAPCSRSCAIGI